MATVGIKELIVYNSDFKKLELFESYGKCEFVQ